MNNKKKWFSLLEIMMIAIIVSSWMATILLWLWHANKYIQKSREKIIAINLAREGMEQIINIRDTNRKRNQGRKEEFRLNIDPINNNTTRFSTGNYIILQWNTGWQIYFYWSWINVGYYENSWFNVNNLKYALCQNTGWWYACPWTIPNSKEWYFFRSVRWVWLYQKNTNTIWGDLINCPNNTDSTCTNNNAKEYRFCVIVNYINESVGKVELCSVLTNFKK